jgi:putative transposase
VKYAWIKSHRGQFPIEVCCRVLEVSASGYHAHQRWTLSKSSRVIATPKLLVLIRSIHLEFKQEYGWPKMHRELRSRGYCVGKTRVQRLMQQHGIRSRVKKRFKVTTDSKHDLPIAPNLLERNFSALQPNTVWTTDITYLYTEQGWLYLTCVIDLYSRMVVGFAIADHMRASLVTDALTMAWFRRRPPPGLIIHSDRGSQYCGHEWSMLLAQYKMRASMSRKGDCWDNSPTESLWGRLKVACVHGYRFTTKQECKDVVMNWLHFYNHRRLHSSLGYMSPMQFEAKRPAASPKKAA